MKIIKESKEVKNIIVEAATTTVVTTPDVPEDATKKEVQDAQIYSTAKISETLDDYYNTAMDHLNSYNKKFDKFVAEHKDDIARYNRRAQHYEDRIDAYEEDLKQWRIETKELHSKINKAEAAGDLDEVDRLEDELPEKPVKPIKPENPLDNAPEPNNFAGNILIEGGMGVGKTTIVTSWCKKKGVRFVKLDATNAASDDFQITIYDKNKETLVKKGTSDYDILDDPHNPGILIIDEFNRATDKVLNAFLNLISQHTIFGETKQTKLRSLRGLLFVVACQNPATEENPAYTGTHMLDAATESRFGKINVEADKREVLKHLENDVYNIDPEVDDEASATRKMQKLELAKRILTDDRFNFDTLETHKKLDRDYSVGNKTGWNKKVTNPRGFCYTIDLARGDKVRLLNNWNDYNNNIHKVVIADILSGYRDNPEDARNRAIEYCKKKFGTNPFNAAGVNEPKEDEVIDPLEAGIDSEVIVSDNKAAAKSGRGSFAAALAASVYKNGGNLK